jgi:hypothetical protein
MDGIDEEKLGKLQVVDIKHIVLSANEMFASVTHNETTPTSDDISAEWYKVPGKIRSRYWGHGITKGDDSQQLAAVMTIAETGYISGTTASFESGWINPYTSGGALVLSRIDSELIAPEHEMVILNDGSGKTKDALKANIGAIVLNASLSHFYEELKSKYPNVVFIQANEINKQVESDIREV